MRDKIVVLEGARLSGKTHLFGSLLRDPGNGPFGAAAYDLFDYRIKDDGFIRRKEFNYLAGANEKLTEAYVIGKDASLTQRLSETRGRLLVDRYMLTSAVYSRVFRGHPLSHGQIYLEDMMKFIQEYHPGLKKRLHFFVLIPDPEIAISETIKGREDKDKEHGMKDSIALLELQNDLYQEHGERLSHWGFNVDFIESFQTNPEVKKQIEALI